MNLDDFTGASRSLVIEDYFDGPCRAWGIFEDRFGGLRRQFTVDILGWRENGRFVLDEHFHYADGEEERRTWHIRNTGRDTYEGRAEGIVGVAEGATRGNALNWRYDMDLEIRGRLWRFSFDDWMFLQPNDVIINRTRISKWGIAVGTVTLFFRRECARATAAGQA